MPPVGAAIAAAVAKITIGSLISGALTSLATSLVMSGLQRLLSKPPKASGSASIQNTGVTTQIRQPIVTRKPIYGEMRRSGGVLFIGMTDSNKYLHMVIEVAPHEVAEIGEVWFNDYSIPNDWLDANGNVTQGRYKDVARIRKYVGTESQTADSFMVSEISGWTTNHRLRGIAYIYVRLKWDQDKYPSGVPNISAWVKGKKIYDPRTTLTTYSNNSALVLNDFLEDPTFGLGADVSEIEQTYLTAAANTCDEFVTVTNYDVDVTAIDTSTDIITLEGDLLYYQTGDKVNVLSSGSIPAGLSGGTDYYIICYQRKTSCRVKLAASYADALSGVAVNITSVGSGTVTLRKIAEPRYTTSVVIDSEQTPEEIIKDLLSGMSGFLTYSSGTYKIVSGSYQTPTVYFNENNIMSGISVQTKVSNRERYNTVRGTYISQINEGQPSDYPEITNSTYITEDGEQIIKQIDLPVTNRPHTAQRIAKINLELARQEITWSADFDLSALQLVAGDNAFFTFANMGWNEKVFQVKEWDLQFRETDETVVPVVKMALREIASANYDWNNGEETTVDPAPNTEIPNVFDVAAVIGLGVSSERIETQDGDSVYKVLLQWTLSEDEFVLNGGFYELEYKRSSDVEWRPTYVIAGNFSFAEVTLAALLNEDYDIRMRAVNSLGVRSAYTSILNYLVGTSGGVGTTEDWGDFASSPVTTEDWGDFSSSPTTTEDWGYFT